MRWDAARSASQRTPRKYKPVGPMAGGPPPGWVQRISAIAPKPDEPASQPVSGCWRSYVTNLEYHSPDCGALRCALATKS